MGYPSVRDNTQILLNDFEKAKSGGYVKILTVTNSAHEMNSYLTPIRLHNGFFLTGIVSCDLDEIREILKYIGDYVDYIFVDIEKKIPPKFTNMKLNSGSYFDILRTEFESLPIKPISPNNLTVNAVISELIKSKLKNKSVSVGIVGLGNLGFKIAQNSVELGCDTFLLSKNVGYREIALENAINFSKPRGTIANAITVNSLEKLVISSDVIIFACPPNQFVTSENINSFKDKLAILDVGKGNISSDVIMKLDNVVWVDVGRELLKHIENDLNYDKLTSEMHASIEELQSGMKLVGKYALPGEMLVNFDGINFYPFAECDKNGKYRRLNYEQILSLTE